MYFYLLFVDTKSITTVITLEIGFIILRCFMNASQMIIASCTFPLMADITDYELSRSGHFSPSVVAMTYSFVQKLISSLGATIVGFAVATIGYVDAMPQATDPFSRPVLHVALFLWLGMPMLGYVCTLIAMKFYTLDQKTMEEIALKNQKIRLSSAIEEKSEIDNKKISAVKKSNDTDSVKLNSNLSNNSADKVSQNSLALKNGG